MALLREAPMPACDEALAPGSYLISTRTEYLLFGALDGAFDNPAPDGRYELSLQHITDGASNTLLVGETNYSNTAWLWSGCAGLNGTPKYGEHTWAGGYWALSWGHMSASSPDLYNNSTQYRPPDSRRSFRSDHPGGVQFVLLDGSVQWLSDGSDPIVRRALVTRAGEEAERQLK
jgi:hypothetical protein